jgi:hypothetical protein
MTSTRLLVLAVLVAFAVEARAADEAKPSAGAAGPKITYDEHILPIFREHCLTCHNQDEAKSDLALDTYAKTMAGGAGGECVLPGDFESSRLYALVSHAETPKMPPNQDRIADAKVELIKKWIVGGALEHSGSRAKIKPKVDLTLTATTGNKPNGPAAMPEKFWRQPFQPSSRAGASTALAASPWSPLVAIAGQKQILLYNSDTTELVTILSFPEGVAHVLKFSRDGSVLLAGGGRGGASGKVVLFDVKTGNRITEVGDELDVVLAADVNNTLSLVALGGPKRMVRVYSVADGTLQYEMKKHTDWIYSLEFSPDGTLLATADRSGGLLIWETGNGREYQNLTGHTGAITDVSWRSDSKLLASASEDKTVKLWTIDNGKMLKGWNANNGALTVEFGTNGTLATGGRDNKIKVWDIDGKQICESPEMADMVLDAVENWDSSRVIAGDWSGACTIFDAKNGKPVGSLSLNPLPLAERVGFLEKQLVEKKAAAAAAEAAAADYQKQVDARIATAKTAVDVANKTAADVKRFEELIPKLNREVPKLQAYAGEAKKKLAELKTKLADAKTTETKAAETLKKSPDSPQAKSLAAGAVERVKKLIGDVAEGEANLKKREAEAAEGVKQLSEANKNLPNLKKQIKPTKDAADKAWIAVNESQKNLEGLKATAKAAADAVTVAERETAQAKIDKVEFDKLGNSQASAK